MRSITTLAAPLAILALAVPAQADCTFPGNEIDLPDGAQADESRMLEARDQAMEKIEELDRYVECLDEELAAIDDTDERAERLRELNFERRMGAIDAMEDIERAFNREVQRFNAAQDE